MRITKLTKILALIIISCYLPVLVVGQTDIANESGKDPLRHKADSLFNAEKYSDAIPVLSKLLESYPRDNEIIYTLGSCYLKGTHNVEKAAELLLKASAGDVPNMVYFNLAEALRQGYRFNEAIDYYRRFTVNGGDPAIKTDTIEQRVALCENGAFLTRYVYTPTVYDVKLATRSDFFKFYSIAPESGSFIPIPDDLLTTIDKRKNHQSIVFFPKNPKVGDYLYYSSFGLSTSYGTDIFRTKYLGNNTWDKPENLGDVVNSSLNEDFPYMMSDGVTLYFASKGHYSMGGYDIFKSVFNEETNTWSNPENVGFPTNSAYDDILFVVSMDDSLACVTTNRSTLNDTVQVVLQKFEPNPVRRSANNYSDINKLSQFKKTINKTVIPPNKSKAVTSNHKPTSKSASFSAVENDPEYSRVIAKGFASQALADSLKERLDILRGKFDYVYTADQRVKLEKQVVKVEDDMLAAQKEADQMFVRASQIEQEYLSGKRKPTSTKNSSFSNDNPKFIYQAQFASTVFQSNEIAKLAQAEKLYDSVQKLRENAITSQETYNNCLIKSTDSSNCNADYKSMLVAMGKYSKTLEPYFEKKYPIYDDCVHVAYAKQGMSDNSVMKDINTAHSHVRTAKTIINNLTEEGQTESMFEASLLEELAINYLDLAFAKIWNLTLFEQQQISNIIKLERQLFGHPNYAEEPKKQKESVETTVTQVTPKLEKEADVEQPIDITVKSNLIPSEFGQSSDIKYGKNNPIPFDKELPNGVCYKIQIGVFSTPRQPSFFKGFYPIAAENVGKKLIKYYIGIFYTLQEANQALNNVKTKGFKDAFVVAWYNGKTISPNRAQSLEGEQPVKSISNPVNVEGVFSIQLGIFESPLPEDELKTVRTLVPEKDIIRKVDLRGFYIYSVGNFNSFDEAERIKDNLIASGFVGAVVVNLNEDK
ncbi:MAG TPA: hypothetical protein P5349_01965 [Tenuifilaceae bacterium]|mgnify:CR=1 FL=1|nr:hypothetical protein [Tenuifilaceae bacterium]